MKKYPDIHTVKKEAYKKIVNGFVPKKVYVSLNQNNGKPCNCLVKAGEVVEEGQKIGDNIFSPIPGVVEGIEKMSMPNGKVCDCIEISLKGSFNFLGKKIPEIDYKLFSEPCLIRMIEDYGVLNTFTTDKPVLISKQMEKVASYKQRILVVRLVDDDPSRLIDSVLSTVYLEEVIKGINIAAFAIKAQGIILVAEKKFPESDKLKKISVPYFIQKVNEKKFPSTFERQIVNAVRKNSNEPLFSKVSKYSLFTDSSTMLELYRSVSFNMPVIDKYVLVNGNCLPATGILKVSIGTTFKSLIEQFGGFVRQPTSVIINGLVTGFSAANLDVPVTKYVKSISFYSVAKTPMQSKSLCIRCGNCRRVCPAQISPDIINSHISGGFASSASYLKSAMQCIECGLCNSVCPSRLPIMQNISDFKQEIQKKASSEITENEVKND